MKHRCQRRYRQAAGSLDFPERTLRIQVREPLLLDRIRSRAVSFTPVQARIAEHVLKDYQALAHSTIRELADKIGVSSSAIVRFAHVLEFPGYPKLQAAAQEMISDRLSMVDRFMTSITNNDNDNDNVEKILLQDMKNLEATAQQLSREALREAAGVLSTSRRIFVVGYRNAAAMSILLSSTLGQLTQNVVQLSFDYGETIDKIVGLDSDDVLVAISFPRYAKQTLQLAAFARQQGSRVIALTDTQTSPLAQLASHAFFAKIDSSVLPYSYAGAVGLINAIVVAVTQELAPVAAERLECWEKTLGAFSLLEGVHSSDIPRRSR